MARRNPSGGLLGAHGPSSYGGVVRSQWAPGAQTVGARRRQELAPVSLIFENSFENLYVQVIITLILWFFCGRSLCLKKTGLKKDEDYILAKNHIQ